MDYRKDIRDYIALEIETLQKMDVDQINGAINLIESTLETDSVVYVMGNGGSASTASHFQNDFNKGVSEKNPRKFRFQCLSDNVATIMAVANDLGFEEVFRFQLEGKLKKGDVVIAISGSGNSGNVIRAVEYAKAQGIKVIGLTGYSGGKLAELADVHVHVPINSMQITEDLHMVMDHLMMSILCKYLCGIEHLS